MMDKELGTRLKLLRSTMGLSLTEAARRLGFPSYQTLAKIEAGEREVKASELARFEKVYFCSAAAILRKKEARQPATILWRKAPEKGQRKELEREIVHRCEQYHLLERLLNVEVSKERGLCEVRSKEEIRTDADIDNLADDTRRDLELGSRPALTLEKILEQNYGVKIIYRRLGDSGSAACMAHPEFGFVAVINGDESPWRRNYDLGHELFHLITFKAVSGDDLADKTLFDWIEKKAERFSSTLLLPETEVRRELNARLKAQGNLTYSDIVDMAREFGVSTVALLYRLVNLRFMNWDHANELSSDEKLRSVDKAARRKEWGAFPTSQRFRFLAVRCLRKGLISRGKFAEMAEIDRSDIDGFIEQFGLAETEGAPVEIVAP